MKANQIRMLSLLLALCTSVGLTACNSSKEPDDVTSSSDTTNPPPETEALTAIPSTVNFGGAECHIFNFDTGSYNNQLLAESETGEVLNDAIYKRNMKVEDTLGVKLVETRESEWYVAFDVAQQLLLAGDDSYDIMFLVDRNALAMAQEGYITPLSEMPYIDLEREYWSQSMNKDMSVRGNLYFSYGDFNLSGYEMVNILVANKSIAEDYKLPNHYDLVLEGKWTIDAMQKNMLAVSSDINGDGSYDKNDQYGITAHTKQVLPNFWIASGLRVIEKTKDDGLEFALTGNEKFANLYDKVFDMMYNDNVYFKADSIDYANNTMFIEGKSLYNMARVAFLKNYRNMEYDYAILPFPKYDEKQDGYYTRNEGGSVSFSPVVSKNKEMAGAVMEMMACESMKTVIPVYYDIVLKNKYARDEKSIEMLEIIYNNRVNDWGDTFWSGDIRDGVFAGKFANNDRDLQSTIASLTPKVEKLISDCIECFDGDSVKKN